MRRKYGYKPNRPVPNLPPQRVGTELERIRQKAGELTPQIVVDESRPATAVLHKELDLHLPIRERAENWARYKARQTINVLTIIPKRPDGSDHDKPMPAFVNITVGPASAPESRSYQTFDDVMADPRMKANMIQRFLEGLVRKQRQFRQVRELDALWTVVDQLAQQFEVVVD